MIVIASYLTRACCTAALVLAASIATLAQTADAGRTDILQRAMRYQLLFRTGQVAVVPEYVAMLETATAASPDDADLWDALGVAYLAQAARAMMPGGSPANALPAMQKGPAALERAIQLNPNHAGALATRGGVQAFMGLYQQSPATTAEGVARMNRAVQIAPASRRVRLQRAFSGINLPDALRNRTAEAEDLDFLVGIATGTRAGDYVRLLRGDLHAETGSAAQAREQYELVAKSSSPATAMAVSRLTSLDQGAVPVADIAKLRQAAGTNCLMCHASGTPTATTH
jgi:hypothetical protein